MRYVILLLRYIDIKFWRSKVSLKPGSEALLIVQLLAVSYLSALVAYFIGTSVRTEELPDVSQRGICDIRQRFPCKECLVRCNDYVRHRNKSCQNIIVNDVIRIIVEEDIGFFLIYIKACSADLTVLNSLNERLSIDQSTSGSIDDNYALLHLRDRRSVDHVPVLIS